MTNSVNVRTPQLTSLETAIKLYYEKPEIGNRDIQELFGKHSSATISRLKNKARQKMAELNTSVWNSNLVNTEVAYLAWGLNISNLEQRYEKLRKLAI